MCSPVVNVSGRCHHQKHAMKAKAENLPASAFGSGAGEWRRLRSRHIAIQQVKTT